MQEKSYRLVPKNELKPEQFPKAVVEALRREGAGDHSSNWGSVSIVEAALSTCEHLTTP